LENGHRNQARINRVTDLGLEFQQARPGVEMKRLMKVNSQAKQNHSGPSTGLVYMFEPDTS